MKGFDRHHQKGDDMVLVIATTVVMLIGCSIAWGSDINSRVVSDVDSLRVAAQRPKPKQAA